MPFLLIRDRTLVSSREHGNESTKLIEHDVSPQWKWDEDYSDAPKLDNDAYEIDEDEHGTEDASHDIPPSLIEPMNDNGDDDSTTESMECIQQCHELGIDECKAKLNTTNDENEDRKPADYTLASISVPVDFKSFTAPSVWIADTEATAHNTPHDEGLTNKNIGTGEKIKSAAMSNIKDTATSNEVQEVHKVVLKEVACTPQ